MRSRAFIAIATLLPTAIGCAASPRDETYSVRVRNDAEVAVVLWLTKDGPPVEADWLSAAQWQVLAGPDDLGGAGVLPSLTLVPRGDATLGPRAGRFGGGTRAVLDAFATPTTPAAMADAPPGSRDHARLALRPGENVVRVVGVNPVRLERSSAESLREQDRRAAPRPESSLPFPDDGAAE